MDVKLIEIVDLANREIPIEVDEFEIGRDPTCHLQLHHGTIGRRHCRLLLRGARVLVEAFQPSGTAVNDHILDPARGPLEVHDGDHLWVGPDHFRVAIAQASSVSARSAAGVRESDEEALNPLFMDVRTLQARLAKNTLERLAGEKANRLGGAEPGTEPEDSYDTLVVAHSEGVANVRIVPKALVADGDVRTLASELGQLIGSGRKCIALNFGNVERMSSQMVGEVFQLSQRCRKEGGMLKLYKVPSEVAGVFEMTGLQRRIEIFADETRVLESHWPKPPSAPPRVEPRRDVPVAVAGAGVRFPAPPKQVRLIVEVGRAKGRAVEVRDPLFVIGRDQGCQLRPNSDAISRRHVAIEQRDGRVYVRDLGSRAGTVLNDRVLRGEECEAFHGDRLRVDVLEFTLAIESEGQDGAGGDDPGLSGMFNAPQTNSATDTVMMRLRDVAEQGAPARPAAPAPALKKRRSLTHEVREQAAVVRLEASDLCDDVEIDALRAELEALLDNPPHPFLVLRFDAVETISRGAVVMLLARFQQFDKLGGMMRACLLSPAVREVVDRTQLPKVMDLFPTLEEALETPWEM